MDECTRCIREFASCVWRMASSATSSRSRGCGFIRLDARQRRAYLERINPLDKAGAYAAQEDRGELIAAVEGSFTNVIGLPMERLARELVGLAGA